MAESPWGISSPLYNCQFIQVKRIVNIPIISQAVQGMGTFGETSCSATGGLCCNGISILAKVASQPAMLIANQNCDVASTSDSTLLQPTMKHVIRNISHTAGNSHQRNPRTPQPVKTFEKG